MAGHLDGDVPPLRIPDVERVVIDKDLLLFEVLDDSLGRALHVPDRGYRPSDQDQEQASLDLVCGQVLLTDVVLVLTSAAVNDRNVVGFGEAAYTATEPTGHAHQMGVVQLFIGSIHQATPPETEAASRVAQRVVRVQDDAIDTVIATVQQVPVPLGQLVGHGARVDQSAPLGATASGRRPEAG